MFSTLSNPLDLTILTIGGVLLLKRVAEMDRYHDLRVVTLTVILSLIVIVLFLAYGFPRVESCVIDLAD